jgi:origin recognition complex subunit 1
MLISDTDIAFDHGLRLPKDPWLRAMHVLHVAARPDELPCRDEEYARILRSVRELIEEGSGGCVCTTIVLRILVNTDTIP